MGEAIAPRAQDRGAVPPRERRRRSFASAMRALAALGPD